MIPHVIVLEPGLVVYKIYNGYWFLGRPTLEDLRQDLRAVSRKCRPDWDITSPELKAAWQQGRKELFYGSGVVFKLDTSNNETVLYNFIGGTDGKGPYAGLTMDSQGNLYGTTQDGGDPSCDFPFGGCGVVFKVDPSGNETVLYSFLGGSDGSYPVASVILDSAGNLYGTTTDGGDPSCEPPTGCGTVFKLDPSGNETVLYAFTRGRDGAYPLASLLRDAASNLYGTAQGGSIRSCGSILGGCGVIFRVTPSGAESVLHAFTSGSDGAYPQAALIRNASGNLYGTASSGGSSGEGIVFKISQN
jgi:uncharacterized repeat protein (TIGR03803 family)